MTNKLKENWKKVDKKCPTCNKITKKAIGINKQNLKKLFWSKPTLQDVIIFIMLIGILTMALNYNKEINQYKKIISNPESFCIRYYNSIISQSLTFSDVNQIENNKIYTDFNMSKKNG